MSKTTIRYGRTLAVLFAMLPALAVAAAFVSTDGSKTLVVDGYELSSGDEVRDLTTNLVWKRCSVGQRWDGKNCLGKAHKLTLKQAQDISPKGWRLPTIRELTTLIYCSSRKTKSVTDPDGKGGIPHNCEDDHSRPTINSNVFPDTEDDWYWSSSPDKKDRKATFSVHFRAGAITGNLHDGMLYVRLIRDN